MELNTSLKNHLEDKIANQKEFLLSKIESAQKIQEKINEMSNIAIGKADDSMTFRLDHLNGIYTQMKELIATLLSIIEFTTYKESQEDKEKSYDATNQAEHKVINDRITKLETNAEVLAGKASMPMVIMVGLGTFISLVVAIIGLLQKFE